MNKRQRNKRKKEEVRRTLPLFLETLEHARQSGMTIAGAVEMFMTLKDAGFISLRRESD